MWWRSPAVCRWRDLYDAVTGRFVAQGASGAARIMVAGDRAAVVVLAPAGGKLTEGRGRTMVDGVVVDYGHGS